jgi:hypothetical protein
MGRIRGGQIATFNGTFVFAENLSSSFTRMKINRRRNAPGLYCTSHAGHPCFGPLASARRRACAALLMIGMNIGLACATATNSSRPPQGTRDGVANESTSPAAADQRRSKQGGELDAANAESRLTEQVFEPGGLTFELDTSTWSEDFDKGKKGELVARYFSRAPANAESTCPTVFAIVAEQSPSDLDLMRFSFTRRAQLPSHEVVEVFAHETGKISIRNAIAYEARSCVGCPSRIFLIHAATAEIVFTIIVQVPDTEWPFVEEEVRELIRSFRLGSEAN